MNNFDEHLTPPLRGTLPNSVSYILKSCIPLLVLMVVAYGYFVLAPYSTAFIEIVANLSFIVFSACLYSIADGYKNVYLRRGQYQNLSDRFFKWSNAIFLLLCTCVTLTAVVFLPINAQVSFGLDVKSPLDTGDCQRVIKYDAEAYRVCEKIKVVKKNLNEKFLITEKTFRPDLYRCNYSFSGDTSGLGFSLKDLPCSFNKAEMVTVLITARSEFGLFSVSHGYDYDIEHAGR